MEKLYFHGSKTTFLQIYQDVKEYFDFTKDYGSANIVIIEIVAYSDVHQLGKFNNKNVFVIIDKPNKELITEFKKYKISGILTKPLKSEIILNKLLNIKNENKVEELLKNESLKAKIIAKAENIPPLPKIARELIVLASKNDVEMEEVVNRIKTDQGISSKILKIINSPFYGMKREISSIERAALYLGLGTVKNIAIALSTSDFFNKNFNLYGTTGKQLWEHAFITARLCEEIAGMTNKKLDLEALYLAGLFHDIGKVVLIDFLFEEVRNISDESNQLGINHIEVAETILKKWKIASKIINWVKNHHEFNPEINSAILFFSNMFANEPELIEENVMDLSRILEIPENKLTDKLKQILIEDSND